MRRKLVLIILCLCLAATVLAVNGCTRKNAEQERPKGEEPNPPAAEKLGYVGSTRCRACHQNQYEGWEGNLHRKMLQDAKGDPGAMIADFAKEGNPFEVVKDFTREDIMYTIGSQWKQRYVVKKGDDFLILPAEWIRQTNSWKPYHPEDWNKPERHYEDLCIACHTTGYREELGAKINEAGVGCEACHGPGSEHASQPKKENIINPKRLTYKQQIETCGQCHVRGVEVKGKREDALGYIPGGEFTKYMDPLEPTEKELAKEKPAFFPDGASKKHHQQYNDYVQSKHYQAEVASCSYCHSSHAAVGPEGEMPLTKPIDNLCEDCHKEGGSAAQIKLEKPYLENYMPKRAKSATEADIRSHTFKPNQPKTAVPKEPYKE